MTVKEVIKVLKNAKRITIGFGDRAIPIDQDDDLMIGFTLADILNACYNRSSRTIATNAADAVDLPHAFRQYFSPLRSHNGEGNAGSPGCRS